MSYIKRNHLLFNVFILILMAANNANAQQDLMNKKFSIRFINSNLEQALTQLSSDYEIPLSYDPALFKDRKKINKIFSNLPLQDILNELLSGTGITYRYVEQAIILVPSEIRNTTISGHIRDAETGEDIIGANLYIPSLKQGVSSNNYGFYSLTLATSTYEIWISHIGYLTKKITVDLQQDNPLLDIRLDKQQYRLSEVEVKQSNTNDSTGQMRFARPLDWEIIKKMPYYKGEPDVIKALQMQNGVVAMNEGSSHLFVRGGNKDQNLILLDEAIVYNPAHLIGLASIFNPDALKNIQIYNDDIPPNFGGRLSSVIDARMADGDDKSFHIKGGVNLLTARLALEGPIVQERGSFLLAARKSLLNLLDKDFDIFTLAPSYYDINFKMNYKLDAANRIFYSAYIGNDRLKSANGYFNRWGNQTSTLRWNHIFNPRLFLNLSAIYSNYKNELNINIDSAAGMDKWVTGVKDVTFKGDFIYYAKPNHQLQFGFSNILHLFIPGEAIKANSLSIPRAKAGEYALYASHKVSLGQHIRFIYGLRASLFKNISTPRFVLLDDDFNPIDLQVNLRGGYKSFFRLEPRLMFQYSFSGKNSVRFTYNRNYQYLQLVQNDELAFSSLETWIPSSPNLEPQQSDFFSLSYKKEIKDYTFSINTYYKKMLNQLELIDHAQIILNPVIEDQLRPGRGDAYGTEFMISKDQGRFKGTFQYTFARVFRKIEDINNGLRYPANYDIPHTFKLSLNYQIADRLLLSSFFTYSSGRPVTLPIGYFTQQGIKVPIYKDRNSSRIQDYHRMDINLTWELKPVHLNSKRQWFSTLSAGVYNVYGKKNALFYRVNQNLSTGNLVEEQSFAGLTPSITYNFRF